MTKKRNYGIDFLRIFSMYMIVILHVLGQGGVLSNLEILSTKFNLAWLLETFCYTSVTCYALITGYVMVNSKFKYKKIVTLWIEVVFWLLLINFITNIINPFLVGKKDILFSFLPVISNKYWYFTSYFCMYFFIPFNNKLIDNIDKNLFKRLILTIIILFSFINLLYDPFKLNNGYSFLWLILCYFIGAYIKKYNPYSKIKTKYLIAGILIPPILTNIFKLVVLKYPQITYELFDCNLFLKYNSPTILLMSICLLILFKRLNITNKYLRRFIKRLSPATFGVYIIHLHPQIWNQIMLSRFKILVNYNPITMILLVLFIAFMIYMLCSYLEMIRIFIFKKVKINKYIDKVYEYIKEKILNINYEKLLKKLEDYNE